MLLFYFAPTIITDYSTYTASKTNESTVIEAYARSLRIVFISAIGIYVIVNLLVFTIKLPHLKKKSREAEEEPESIQ
jgi:surface polysaccharide O-acyltransferase-like enzyme